MAIEGLLVLGYVAKCENNVGKLLAIEYFLSVEFRQSNTGSEENLVTFVE